MLDLRVDLDHVLGPPDAEMTLVEIAIFLASLIAGGLGVLILWPKSTENGDLEIADHRLQNGRQDV
jgi:hypothetical protein